VRESSSIINREIGGTNCTLLGASRNIQDRKGMEREVLTTTLAENRGGQEDRGWGKNPLFYLKEETCKVKRGGKRLGVTSAVQGALREQGKENLNVP